MVVESLEQRTLMAAVPASYVADYNKLIADNGALEAIALQFKTSLLTDEKTISADLKAIGTTKATSALLKQGEAAGATIASLASSGAKDFAKASPSVYRTFAAAQSAFASKPNLANGHRYTHAISAMQTISNYNYSRTIQTIIAKQIVAEEKVQSVLSGFASAHPGAQPLNTDIQTVQSQLTALPAELDNEEDVVAADINTFEDAR